MDAGELPRGAVPAGSPATRVGVLPRGVWARFVLAGAWVGLNDISFAIAVWTGIYRRVSPERILQSIAAGLLGPASFEGGAATAVLGLFLHFVVAYGWTAVFLVALLTWPALRARAARPGWALGLGLLYGALVWLGMDFIVLPLSRARATSVSAPWFWMQLVQHPFLVGLPIVWVLRPLTARPRPPAAGR